MKRGEVHGFLTRSLVMHVNRLQLNLVSMAVNILRHYLDNYRDTDVDWRGFIRLIYLVGAC
jgi:hypothetical protein